ncbi:hypothetical protein BSKO_07568 [Bryopsis sp. KO-2023]|nr:hypothetical protein BSKO_07568 [Bryopsis sp. KO-2023]
MALFVTKHRVGPARLCVFGLAGLFIGLTVGYIFMASSQAVMEVGAENHWIEENGNAVTLKTADTKKKATAGDGKVDWGNPDSVQAIKGSKEWPTKGDTIHVILTSNGSPYQNIQTRIMYATYKIARKMPGGEKMVALTRVLHRTAEDALMKEVPTFRAEPHDPKCDIWCEFPVADRPGAVRQFLEAAARTPSLIKAPWLLLIESDYVWKKPVVAPMADSSAKAQAFPFSYIPPAHSNVAAAMRAMYPEEKGPLTAIMNSGPAPVLLRVDELRKITPEWERLTYFIESTPTIKQTLGWIREMYAFSIAAALQNVPFDLPVPGENQLIVQPPEDKRIGNAAMYHYTWGLFFLEKNGTKVFTFEKRFYIKQEDVYKVPHMSIPPPFKKGWSLLEGNEVTKDMYETIKDMIITMNAGIDTLDVLPPFPS